jgi:hypothetical protein
MYEYDPQTHELKTIDEVEHSFERLELWQLRWLLDFAQRPERWIRPNQRKILSRELRSFIGEVPRPLPGRPALQKLSSAVLEGVHRLVVEHQTWKVDLGAGRLTRELEWFPDFIFGLYRSINWHNAFLLRMTDLLVSRGACIRQCAEQDCGRLFVPTKRQAYCSTNCSQKARQQRFRAAHSQEELSEKRHEHYRNKVKRIKGPEAAKHVARRPNRNAAEVPKEAATQEKGGEDGTV